MSIVKYNLNQTFLLIRNFTISTSLWLKNKLFPVSIDLILFMSSAESSKSKILKFSIILSLWTLFVITTTFLCISHLNITWAADLLYFFSYFWQNRICKHIASTFGKRSPRFYLRSIIFHYLVIVFSLKKRMSFYLINRWFNFIMFRQIH